MPAGREPLKTAPALKGLLQKYYKDVQAAADNPDRMIAYCSGTGPAEIVRAMGMTPYFPENQAALIGAGRQTGDYITRALQEGFSQHASSAMTSDIGAMLAGDSPLVKVYGIDGPPDPDVVVYSTNFGHERIRWFEYYGRHFNVPTFGLHPPSVLGDINEIEFGVAHRQLERLIEELEGATGGKLDHHRLAETVSLTLQATRLWGEILDLCRNEPAPLTYFDTLIHLAPVIVMRGTVEAVEYYTLLKAEVEERIAKGIAAVPGERFRFYWEGPPIWPALRPISELFQSNRVAVVASTYCN
ncbi:MAG: 2-hydroxyacyl-CoA dehydratase, partial [bacterium]|nr:2-hydroxyacyl-CoA dehydratase [bacterium]